MDTTAINFGISKLTEAFSAIQPKVSELTAQFIQFKVFEQLAYNVLALVSIPIIIFLYIPVAKYGKGKGGFNKYDQVGFMTPTIILIFCMIFAVIIGIIMIPDSLLAIKFPEVFAIQSMLPSR